MMDLLRLLRLRLGGTLGMIQGAAFATGDVTSAQLANIPCDVTREGEERRVLAGSGIASRKVRCEYDGSSWAWGEVGVAALSGLIAGAYTDEQARDAIGTALTDSTTIDFTVNDGANTITAAVIQAGLTLSSIGGSVTDAQVPNTITLDNITQITTRSHASLASIGTNTHAQIDTHLAATGTAVHGLGTMSTQGAGAVAITGGSVTGITDITVADGGTGASTAAGARTNLGLDAGGTGDIWVEKAGDTMTASLIIDSASAAEMTLDAGAASDVSRILLKTAGTTEWIVGRDVSAGAYPGDFQIVNNDTGHVVFAISDVDDMSRFNYDVTVPNEAYGSGWDGSLEVPTKDAVYDKIQSIAGGGTGDVVGPASSVNNQFAFFSGTTGKLLAADPTGIGGILSISASGTYPGPLNTTGTGDVVRASSPAIVTPTIADFTNATHSHQNNAGGGVLAAPGITSFTNATHTHTNAAGGGVLGPAALGVIGIYQDSDYTGTNVNTAQKMFDESTNGAATVAASTGYLLKAVIHIHTTGTTSHDLRIIFNAGTATFTSFDYGWMTAVTPVAVEASAIISNSWKAAATEEILTAAVAAASHHTVTLEGIIRVNAGGTFIPQFRWSAAPGGTTTVLRGSRLELTPFGTNLTTTVGTWT